ncbi:MAG: hypothetical protein OEW08_13560 [Gammaproteobacteria bacterium]|nr:hypothetical protein [Gammaproteobacteria bacterium]
MTQDDIAARIQKLTQRMLEQGVDVQREIRELSLQALREGKLDREHISAIVGAVVKGVKEARTTAAPPPTSPVAQALRGVEEALSASAEALKLALQEAASRTRQVTQQELRRGKEDLLTLEKMFVEIVAAMSQGTQQNAHHTWDDFATHVADNTTRLSAQIRDVMAQLQQYLEQEAKQSAQKGSDTMTKLINGLANTAADALGRLADSLRRGDKSNKD